jgi:hypothetical protein
VHFLLVSEFEINGSCLTRVIGKRMYSLGSEECMLQRCKSYPDSEVQEFLCDLDKLPGEHGVSVHSGYKLTILCLWWSSGWYLPTSTYGVTTRRPPLTYLPP